MATVNVMDYIDPRYWGSIENHRQNDAVTNGFIRAAEALPTNGGKILVPGGRYPAFDFRLDSGSRNGIELLGDGPSSHIIKLTDSSLSTAADKKANVIHAQGGSGFALRDLKIEGNRSRGGGAPPFATRWTGATAYTTGQVVSTKSDGTAAATNAELTAANGARTFLVAQNHTSHATDIDNDVPTNVTEVTSQRWDELTQTGYLPSADVDADYANRHALYLHGEADFITDCLVENVEVADAVYGGIVGGSGPLFATGVGIGAKRITTINCYAHDCGGSNFGGGFNTFCTHIAPRTLGGYSSGIRLDEGSNDSVIIGAIVDGTGGDIDNGGVNLYKSHRCKVIAPRVRNVSSLPVWIVECTDYELIGNDTGSTSPTITSSSPADTIFYRAPAVLSDNDGRTLVPGESGRTFHNSGATARTDYTLPAAVNGLEFTFINLDSDGTRVIPAGDDTIRVGTSLSGEGSAGRIDATALGAVITLRAISFTTWIAIRTEGTWTVT